MTNHEVKNGRREFLLTVSGGIVGLAVGSMRARVLAQPAGGPPLSISTIGAGREGTALGALFVKAGHRVFIPPSRDIEGTGRRARSVGPRRNGCGGRRIWRRRD